MQTRTCNTTKLYFNFMLCSTGKKKGGVTERTSEHKTEARPESLRAPDVNTINRNIDTKDQA